MLTCTGVAVHLAGTPHLPHLPGPPVHGQEVSYIDSQVVPLVLSRLQDKCWLPPNLPNLLLLSVQQVLCAVHTVYSRYCVQYILCASGTVYSMYCVYQVCYTEGTVYSTYFIQQVLYTEGTLYRYSSPTCSSSVNSRYCWLPATPIST